MARRYTTPLTSVIWCGWGLSRTKGGCWMKDRAISLNAVIDALDQSINILEAEDRIRELPSVKTQEPKTGHWIDLKEDNEMSDENMWRYSCNMCHGQNFRKTLFCPNCGCAMVEPQESEVSNG